MPGFYFAYGSNLKFERMSSRVTSARFRARARLGGWSLTLDKSGRDGSGKANLRRQETHHVWGVVYSIDPSHWPRLDTCEPGYSRVEIQVVTEAGDDLDAETYVAQVLTNDPVAFDWYKELLLEGAREHALPDDYVAGLAHLAARPDPRREA